MKRLVFLGLCVLLFWGAEGQVTDSVLRAPAFCSRHAGMGGIRLALRGIYVDSGLLWLVFRGYNHSSIDFRPGGMRFFFRDRHALRRRALQELRLPPLVRHEAGVVRADSTVTLCYGLLPRVPGNRQELVIEWVERNGDRRMLLRVPGRVLLTAHRL